MKYNVIVNLIETVSIEIEADNERAAEIEAEIIIREGRLGEMCPETLTMDIDDTFELIDVEEGDD